MEFPDSTKTYPNGASYQQEHPENRTQHDANPCDEPENLQTPEQYSELKTIITPQPNKLLQELTLHNLDLPDESINITNFGDIEYSISQTRNCFLSANNIWEIKREAPISINIKIPQDTIPASLLLIRTELVKKQGTKNFGVTVVCTQHQDVKRMRSQGHVLHPGTGMKSYFDSKNMNNSLCFQLSQFKNIQESRTAQICVRSLCTSTCLANSDPNYNHSEAELENILVLSLEAPHLGITLAKTSVPVRIKDKSSSTNSKINERKIKPLNLANDAIKHKNNKSKPRCQTIISNQKQLKGIKKILMGACEIMRALEYPNFQLIETIEKECNKLVNVVHK